jgi:hypothetical protein
LSFIKSGFGLKFFFEFVGEINTLRGNKNWMRAREGVMKSEIFASHLETLYPIIEDGGSDSAAFDNVLELLIMNNVVTLPEAVMMMVPEAWQNQPSMEPEKRAFYEWAAMLMEPWVRRFFFRFFDFASHHLLYFYRMVLHSLPFLMDVMLVLHLTEMAFVLAAFTSPRMTL